jgi:DNA-binding IclR family transcriptional regulator
MAVDTVTSRVLRILSAFTGARPSMSLSQISRDAMLPLSTTHRLVAELMAWGALERDPAGTYRIGLRLWEVAALAPRGVGLRDAALPYMEDLYEATHENVQLAVLDNLEVVYLERIRGPRRRTRLHPAGAAVHPARDRCRARPARSQPPPRVQEGYLDRPLRTFTAKTIADRRRLRSVLAEVRRHGYAVSDGQVTLDALSVAAPVRCDDTVIAALSIVVHGDRFPAPSTLAPAVVAAALGISRSLTRASSTE